MKDPERLLSNGATDFERQLLRAARLERPSSAQHRRMRRAVFLAEIGFLSVGFKAVASVGNQLVAVAIMASALTGTGSSTTTEPSQRPAQTAAQTGFQPAPTPSEVGQPPVITNSPPYVVPTEELTRAETKAVEPKIPPRLNTPAKTVDLREEIRLLDEARMAIRTNNPARALTTINRYLSGFPRGSFRQEASVLRIEALSLSGSTAQAAAEAKSFVAKHPKSPHVDKLQRVTQSSTNQSRP